MALAKYHRPPMFFWHPAQWRRSLENHVLQKAVRDHVNRLIYGATVPPSDGAIFVRPADVNFRRGPGGDGRVLRRRDSARVVGGDWDLYRSPVDEEPRIVSCRMRFVEGADWEETPFFQRLLRQIEQGKRPDGCRTREDLEARYAGIDRMVEETRARGYLLRREELPECFRREHGGILLHVARDGTLLRQGGGGHRFAIARVLNLPEMPAQIGAIHRLAVRAGHVARLRREPSVR